MSVRKTERLIFRALRTVPVMLDFARDIEEVASDAWMLNYTNPMCMVTGAMLRGSIEALVAAGVIPASVADFAAAPAAVPRAENAGAISCAVVASAAASSRGSALILGGGTDWYVRNPEPGSVWTYPLRSLREGRALRRDRSSVSGSRRSS